MRAQGDETELFERHHEWLRGAVAQYSSAPEHLVDEACSFAWERLLTHQPDRERVAGWLWKTALRKAWRLEQFEAREAELTTRRAGACSPIETRHRLLEALGALADLRPRQRRLVGLQAAGHTYDEIAARTGESWRTVDRNSSAHASASPPPDQRVGRVRSASSRAFRAPAQQSRPLGVPGALMRPRPG